MSGRVRQKAGASSPPPSCPSLSCLQCLPLHLHSILQVLPYTVGWGTPPGPPQLHLTPSKLLPEKGGASKAEPGLEPHLLDATLPALPSILRAGERALSCLAPRSQTGRGTPLGKGAEAAGRCPGASLAARVLSGERTLCQPDPRSTARRCCGPRGPHGTAQGSWAPHSACWLGTGLQPLAQPAHSVCTLGRPPCFILGPALHAQPGSHARSCSTVEL